MDLNISDGIETGGQGHRALFRQDTVSTVPSKENKTVGKAPPRSDAGIGDNASKSLHKKRFRTMGNDREMTIDQDDLQPIEEQEEAFDVQHVLGLTMSREAMLREEMKVVKKQKQYSSDDDGPDADYGSDRDEGFVSFAGQATFSRHSRKEARKARRPKFERSNDAVVQVGSLTRAGNALEGDLMGKESGFGALGVSDTLSAHLEKHGYKSPTTVQGRGIPILLQRKDAMIESPTGSGKTLTYLIPIFETLCALADKKVSRSDGTLALILCPTRELCLQVLDIATIISRRYTWIVPGSIHGGENRSKEKARLRKGINVLISTPGRLFDHLVNTTSFKVSKVQWVVLDEADRLLDMGFKKQLDSIFTVLQQKASIDSHWQIALFSATLHGVQDLLSILPMRNPVSIKAGISSDDDVHEKKTQFYDNIPKKLLQRYIVVPCKFRLVTLFAALKQHMGQASSAKVLIFLSNCDSVDFHQILLQKQWNTTPTVEKAKQRESGRDDCNAAIQTEAPAVIKLHGNMSQVERTRSLLAFTKASRGILLATDVASRGLDFPKISMIIQYDAPTSSEEYVHRVGRTARFGTNGESLLFVIPAECGFINYLHSHCGIVSLEKSDTPTLLNNVYGNDAKAGKSIALELHRGSNRASQAFKACLSQDLTVLAEMAFTSSVRAYATHSKELKEYFRIKNLHLGHYANNFGLKDTPAMAGKHGSSRHNKGGKSSKNSRLAFSADQGFSRKGTTRGTLARSQNARLQSKKNPTMYVSS